MSRDNSCFKFSKPCNGHALILQPGFFGRNRYFRIRSATWQNHRGSGLYHNSLILLASSKGPDCSTKSREAYGDGVVIVVRGRESRPHGEGPQVSDDRSI